MNQVEIDMETDFNAESAITDVFNKIERGFRQNPVYGKHEHPVLTFEVISCENGDDDDVEETENVLINIIVQGGNLKTVRQSAKQYVSLIRDFLKSDQWTYIYNTKTGRSEVITLEEKGIFRAFGLVECAVSVKLPETTLK